MPKATIIESVIECFYVTSRQPYCCSKTMKWRPCCCPIPILRGLNFFLMQTLSFVPINLHRCWPHEWKYSIERFHMTLRRPYWCPKTMKRRPCWCPKPILWELNSFLMQTLSFVLINLHRCWPREWKHSIYKGNGLDLGAEPPCINSGWFVRYPLLPGGNNVAL